MWSDGAPYDAFMGDWSRLVAPRFIDWLALPPSLRWLDAGCGTGALTETILSSTSPSLVIGVDPSPGFIASADARLGDRARFEVGAAERLPLAADSVDATVSGLVLNFVPDASVALAEFERVTVPGGTIGAYVWDYAGRMDLIRDFWEIARELDPDADAEDESTRFGYESPESLWAAFETSQLVDVDATGFEVSRRYAGFEEFWNPFLGGQGPAPSYVARLTEPARARLRAGLREALPFAPDGTLELRARAWAVRGTVPPGS